MKKVIFIGLLIMTMALPTFGIEQLDIEKIELEDLVRYQRDFVRYQKERKEPWVAVAASWTIPTLGHAYAGDWVRGLPFFVAEVACGFGMAFGYENIAKFGLKDDSLLLVSYVGFFATKIWECVDAHAAVDDYNSALWKKYNLSVDINKNDLKVGVVYHF